VEDRCQWGETSIRDGGKRSTRRGDAVVRDFRQGGSELRRG
jgi:hypothetical protein